MKASHESEETLSLWAADALEPSDEARVRAHVEACEACRREVDAQREVLGLAALPPPSVREQAVLEALPRTTVGVWRRTQVRQAARMRTTGGLLAVAAAALLMIGPMTRTSTVSPPRATTPVGSATAPADEEILTLEQWALADPLSDALDDWDTGLDTSDDGVDAWDVEPEDFLSPAPFGDTP
ncbi:anti-sigma factor family protein [Archangium primigenium]|uniref:anti-sigma factor family protein n=1 Tax=[Archangium] primigenium TaxID=2792470 RepID=UPI0019568B22|nr:zf-HC2 domain-containing protein [Archangium primigenium]MBM7118283.1 zf-HC2 domain-containing protein [Archangium primigenium]